MILTCGRKSVKDCITSIKDTIHSDYELILVDNGNTCDTSVQDEVDIYIGLRQNLGVLSRNYGKLAARGHYIACIDDDVIMSDGWDDIFLHVLMTESDVIGVGPDGHYVYRDLSNYNEKPGIPGRYVDVLTGYCWMHRNVPEGLLPWDWCGFDGRPSTIHDETCVQFQMREKGYRFKQTHMVCIHNSQRGDVDKNFWIDHDNKIERIKNRFNIKDLHLEERLY